MVFMLHNQDVSESNLDSEAGCSEDFHGFIRNYPPKILRY